MAWVVASSDRESMQRDRVKRKRMTLEKERYREKVLIDRGRGKWSEGIQFFHIRGQQVSERLRGEAMQEFMYFPKKG